ncbi:MAG: multidrug transporter [Anaerolineales bacterium]|nr:MAG: multidrug transporter [Anaerolineales bacterium]
MRKIILRDRRKIFPFNQPARDLRVLNKPLWLHQRDVLSGHVNEEQEVDSLAEATGDRKETLVYRDNLFFDRFFIDEFIRRAREKREPCRVALSRDDKAITTHATSVQQGIRREGEVYVADLWYFPSGVEATARPLVIDTQPREMGYYHVPTHLSDRMGDLIYQVPTRAFCSIEHWVHLITANITFGVFANGARADRDLDRSALMNLKVLWRSLLQRRQVLSSSALVHVGRSCRIDPTAIIRGPTYIGDNVNIGAGAIVDVSIIGDDVDIFAGSHVSFSVVSDRCFLPFRAALFTTVLMEDSMVAQNSCLQFCCVGRGTLIGAGTTFTDLSLVPKPIRAHYEGDLADTGMPVLGACVGHNCFIGSGLIVYPARAIESDVVLLASDKRQVVDKNVHYEDSDHFAIKDGEQKHSRLYPR